MPVRGGLAFAISLIALSISANNASASNCIDEVQRIAHDYALAINPPDAGTVITPEELARSGGVIEPPAVGDPAVTEPPMPGSAMPTTPELPSSGQAGARSQSLNRK